MTSIEYLQKEYNENKGFLGSSNFEQAKEMEKKQITDSYLIGLFHPIEIDANQQAEEYYNDTYGSGVLTDGSGAVGKKGGAVNKGSDDQVPDVRKMVEDDNYLTPVDWLMDRIKWIHRETYDYLIKEGQYDVAKRTENAILDKTNEFTSSQTTNTK